MYPSSRCCAAYVICVSMSDGGRKELLTSIGVFMVLTTNPNKNFLWAELERQQDAPIQDANGFVEMSWEVFTLPGIFHMDSNPIPWTPYGLFFGWQPSHFFIPYPLWSPYGMDHSMDIPCPGPCGFHGISNEFTLQIHVLFHMDSMEESTSNSVENPLNGLSKIVTTSRIEHSALQHITCMRKRAFIPLSHLTVVGYSTALS